MTGKTRPNAVTRNSGAVIAVSSVAAVAALPLLFETKMSPGPRSAGWYVAMFAIAALVWGAGRLSGRRKKSTVPDGQGADGHAEVVRLRATYVNPVPRFITTETDLCMLPDRSVVLSDSIAYQKVSGADWDGLGRGWHVSQIDLPAVVLHSPGGTE
jgi:hypothetical protein